MASAFISIRISSPALHFKFMADAITHIKYRLMKKTLREKKEENYNILVFDVSNEIKEWNFPFFSLVFMNQA